jgi:YD repeat-containing protein
VTAPDGVHTYMHVGANSINSGAVYSIGLLLFKSIGNGYQNEGYLWDLQVVSNTINERPGTPWITDGAIAATMPALKAVVRNGQSYVTTYSNFDPYGNPQSIAESGTETRTTAKTYNVLPDKWILRLPKDETISTIGSITRGYDGNGNLLSENKFGVTTSFTYTTEGSIATKRDARGNTIAYSQYKRGVPQSEGHPEAVTITRAVDDAGNITSQTDGEGATTAYAYDGLNRLTSIVHPAGNAVTVTWGQNSRVVQRGSFREFTAFDAYGRESSVQLDGGAAGPIAQTSLYDPVNRKIFASYFNSASGTHYQYDPLGRIFSTSHVATPLPSGLFTATGGRRRSTFAANMVTNTNERGLVYRMTYRGYGDPDRLDLMQIAAPDPAANVAITRNGLGQPLAITQAGTTRSNVYDTRYFLTQTLNPEIGTTLYGRDEVGNMVSRKVASSGTTNYAYDGRNRLVSIQYPAGTPSVTKSYFRDDLLRSVDNGVSLRDYLYSPNKSLTRETLAVGATTLAVDYAYDANDALQSMSYGTGLTVNYGPDGLGRPTRAAPFANLVTFQPNGLLRQITYANGIVGNFAINDRQWPSNVTYAQPGGASVLNLTNTYDLAGNVTNIVESVQGQQNRTLVYDTLDRLSVVSMPGVPGGTLTYDGAGNIRTQQLGTTSLSYQYDTSNKLVSVTGSRNMNFGYDVYGNVNSNSRNQFQYDDAPVLTCVDCGTPNEIRYLYDGMGTRVSEQRGALTTLFMYGSHGNLLFELDSNGVKREYGYVADRNIARKVSQ